MNIPTIGALAYYDSLTAGLIPCRVEKHVERSDYAGPEVVVKFTASRGPYKRGETVQSLPRYIVPRFAVHTRGGQYRIGAYSWTGLESN